MAVIALAVAVVACSTQPIASGSTDGRIGVAVGAIQGEDMVLEIGDRAWGIPDGGGVVALAEAIGPTSVRLVAAEDCSVVVAFSAEPNRRYVIEASAELDADWRDATDEAFPMGPGTDERPPTGCP